MATAKISIKSKILLERIQHISGCTKTAIIEEALKELDRRIAIKKLNEAYFRLKKNPGAWEDELEERQELEGTIGDGLFDEEV